MTGGARPVLVSIVSHGHRASLDALLDDLALPGNAENIRVLLTLNLASETLPAGGRPYPLQVVRNARPAGFAENHNTAFRLGMAEAAAPFFCVLNPDVRLEAGVMSALLRRITSPPHPALLAPAVFSSSGTLQDSARPWPTPFAVLGRVFNRLSGQHVGGVTEVSRWDWLAGMFMLFDAAAFRQVEGFDAGYFLYYEDADICCRLRLAGHRLAYCPEIRVVHDARRDSHHRLGYLRHHVRSVVRFFLSPSYSRCRLLRNPERLDSTHV